MDSVICMKIKKEAGFFLEKFKFDEGEEYRVKIIITAGRLHDVRISLEWKKRSNVFIRAKIYCDTCTPSYRKTVIIEEGNYVLFTSSLCLSNCGNILLIKISQWKPLRKCTHNLLPININDPPRAKRSKKEPVTGERLLDLSTDLKTLLESGFLSDIVLTDETNKIRAHKLILSARSPVFSKMLQHEMRESLENVIIIKDIPMDVLKKLLDFMYTGEVIVQDMKMACGLYVAGDKYDVKGLKEICSNMLRKVDLDNVLQTILLGNLYSDDPLKQAALEFIHDNFSQVKALHSWQGFLKENQTLAIEVLSSELERRK